MPCYDSRSEPAYQLAEARKAWTHNSPVAQMLCTVMKAMPQDTINRLPADIRQWWTDHQARDVEKDAKS